MKLYYWRESIFKLNVVYVDTKIVTVLNNLQIYLLRLVYTVSNIMHAVHIGDVRVKYNAIVWKILVGINPRSIFQCRIQQTFHPSV